eukprot:666781-Rhodomonas_salina.5
MTEKRISESSWDCAEVEDQVRVSREKQGKRLTDDCNEQRQSKGEGADNKRQGRNENERKRKKYEAERGCIALRRNGQKTSMMLCGTIGG